MVDGDEVDLGVFGEKGLAYVEGELFPICGDVSGGGQLCVKHSYIGTSLTLLGRKYGLGILGSLWYRWAFASMGSSVTSCRRR